ncbi:MAG: YraN family protein [Anaerolineae bacterium]
MTRNQSIGRWGEQAAADYLCTHGYELLARNIRTPYGEIDLVASKAGITVFVEVKARTSKSFGPPELAVTPRKQAHMLACAEHYAQQNEIDHWQIDVIAVERCNDATELMHFENAIS